MKQLQLKSLSTNLLVLISAISVLLYGCEKEPKSPGKSTQPSAGRTAFVLNEGSLGNGNASLSVLNLDSNIITNNIFSDQNHQDIGDILHSGTIIQNNLYLAVTNSNVIRIVHTETYKEIGKINITTPRYIYPINENYAYVSSYGHQKVHVINLKQNEVVESITVPYSHIEQMLIEQDKAYVCNWDTANNKLYVINTQTNNLIDSITLAGKAPHSIFKDKHDIVWVFGGNKNNNIPASITKIKNGQVVGSFLFPSQYEIVKPYYYAKTDEVFYINVDYYYRDPQGIFKMKATDSNLPTEVFIPASAYQYFYSLQVDPETDDIFLTDPKGFVQRGDLLRYNAQGILLQKLETNIGPNGLVFIP